MKVLTLACIVILSVICDNVQTWRLFKNGRRRFGNVGVPEEVPDREPPPDEWVDQSLDHFNPTDTRTWKQRYFTNDSFYEPGGPVFLMIGGEGEASPFWMVDGAWIDYAMQLNALCFQVEHRYYGQSRPTDDLSVENMMYLSSEQALADLANFIVTMNKQYEFPEGTKWVAFGGSYSGSLAAWLRAKYSHLVHAAVSTSGPLLAKLNFKEYLGVVRESLATAGEGCVDAFQDAFDHIGLRLEHLQEEFRLCDEVDVESKMDIANLFEVLIDNIAGIVQYNKDSPYSNMTIDYVCSYLMDDSLGLPIVRYAKFITDLLGDEDCIDFKYDPMISEVQNTTWDSNVAEGERQWYYQTCTEFGFYQTTDESPHVFGEEIPLPFFIQQCMDIFGEKFNYSFVKDAVHRTNTIYGALSIDVSNVVYVHGTIDPWHALGITETRSDDAPAILINGTAHCADMYPSYPEDLPQLTDAREKIFEYLSEWLK